MSGVVGSCEVLRGVVQPREVSFGLVTSGTVTVGLKDREAMMANLTLATETHYTPQQVAEMWGISEATVIRIFQDEEGVLKLSLSRGLTGRRAPRVSLRIPASVLERVHEQRSAGWSSKIQLRRG